MSSLLIVEDDEQLLHGLVRQLGRLFGAESVVGVSSVAAALDQASRIMFDVVVTDVMMPERDGFDLCRSFRANPLNLGYIIILTGRDGGIAEGLRAGADVYFRKPYDLDDLVAQIEKGIEVAQTRRFLVQDPLTGLYLRRIFDAVFALESARLRREASSLAVILFDIDHFKRVNDTYGHPVGDQVLREAAQILKKCSRQSDLFVRYGGEEFLLLLPGSGEAQAMEVAQRLHESMGTWVFPEVGRVTASFGVAVTAHHPERLVLRADQALYRAKSGGRNRVERAESEDIHSHMPE